MQLYEIFQPLLFDLHMRGVQGDQSDLTLAAYKDGERVGYIEFSVWHGEVSVQMIRALRSGLGVGPALVRELQRRYPDIGIQFGMLTDDGAKMLAKIPMTYVPNPEFKTLSDRLAAVKTTLHDWQKRADAISDRSSAAEKAWLSGIGDKWNDLHSEEWDLEQQLRSMEPGKHLIDLS